MTDLMLDQFGGIPEEKLKAILEKKRKSMIDSDVDLSEAKKSRTRELDSHIEVSHLSWLRFPLQRLTKMLSRCGSIPGANFLITLWRGGSL
jgi:hypothetical protein